MRRMQLIAIFGAITVMLGVVAGTVGCSNTSESDGPADEMPERQRWEVESPTEEWDADRDVRSPEEDSPEEPSITEPAMIEELARELASFSSGETIGESQLFEVVDQARPLTVRVELPGKELMVLATLFESFEEFARCPRSERCGAGDEVRAIWADSGGISEAQVRACAEGCCDFAESWSSRDSIRIRRICYEPVDENVLALTEIVLTDDRP